MNQLRVDDRFSSALRAQLVAQVQKSSTARTRQRTRLWLSAGALAATGLLGGIGAAAAGLFVIPGTEQGTATVELGEPPQDATGIEMTLTALTVGSFEFPDGASATFRELQADTRANTSGHTVSLAPGQHSVTIKPGPEPAGSSPPST
ncbi:hypothetical protein ABFP37_18235 [Burkholderia sp. RS01]|uniref:hypothetical protein n=1 Tax=unclassified Burkholderia TaxID=2613784 RepID=UPI003218CC11